LARRHAASLGFAPFEYLVMGFIYKMKSVSSNPNKRTGSLYRKETGLSYELKEG